jgi:FixJ family two-component response regulator
VHQLTVFIVDDDASVRDSLGLMLGLAGYRTALFADAETFLAQVRSGDAGCCVVDLKLPGKSGLELQRDLAARAIDLPVIVITAHGDVPAARAAFRARAVDFLEKPFQPEALLSAIGHALSAVEKRIERNRGHVAEQTKLASLTGRERQVLKRVALGLHAKEIAAALGISPRTVEVHKAHLMDKLGARNAVELARFAIDPDQDA